MDSLQQQKGSVLVIGLMLMLGILLLLPVGAQLITTSFKETQFFQNSYAQAENVARAGLIDAISWFRRQTTQPVKAGYPVPAGTWADAAFYPRYSTSTALSDTIDEDIGLVKEYQLGAGQSTIWARYEVKRQQDPAVYGYDQYAVHDFTAERLHSSNDHLGDGLVWYIVSTGYVYRKKSNAVAYNQSPNEIICTAKLSTEIRRLKLVLPANSAHIVNYGGPSSPTSSRTVQVKSNTRLIGTGGAYGSVRCTGSAPYVLSGGTVSSSGVFTDLPTCDNIFGVTENELKLLADYSVTSVNSLPVTLPSMAIVFINGNASFDSNHQLKGGGILYIKGNLTVNNSANTLYSGVIYVTGTATIYGPALITGCVVTYTGLTIYGTSGTAEIDYDQNIINSVRQKLGVYRENKAAYHVFSIFKS